ncbi:MAG: M23 family peptidase [Proteobacteria bacterium]|nr:MAG: M23 family peptidase [Pseudomonadota bacterium]
MIKNEPRLKSEQQRGLHPVEDNSFDADPVGDDAVPSAPYTRPRHTHRAITDLDTELERNGLNPNLIDPNVVLLPKRIFLFPRVHPNDDEHRYMRRVRTRSALVTLWLSVVTLFVVVALASMIFTANERFFKPLEQQEHQQLLESELEEIIGNTRLGIDPVDPQLPDWLRTSFSPDWYIEDAIYSSSLDLFDRDIELLSFLREKKAIVAREIEPAYSNDKLQNRLRDPNIIYFGSDYDRAYRRFVNTVLAISAIARDENTTPGLDSLFTAKRRSDLIGKITTPKPPEPNSYYDSRVESMIRDLSADGHFSERVDSLAVDSKDEHEKMLAMLDDIYTEIGAEAFGELSDGGLGPLLQKLPYGWSSNDLTRTFYEDKRKRFIDWNVLELRLLMLDLIYSAAELPQELPLVQLYLYHLGGEGYQTLYARVANDRIMSDAIEWVANDIDRENNPNSREQRFIDEFINHEHLKIEEDAEANGRRVALSLLFKAARFEHAYQVVESASEVLTARPFLGKMGLPVRSLEADEIKPWGLFKARRNGYSHEGLDIGGEIGEPALAVMDGAIVRAGYQRGGAGNYVVLAQDNIEVTYMHLLREPSRSNYKPLLTREELADVGNDSRRGYELALRKYASIILGKRVDALTEPDLDLAYLRENSAFERILAAVRKGGNPRVRKGEIIANIGMSGNVTLNSARPEMIYPHIHLEINGGRIDPMQVIEGIGSRWYEIRDHHLNHPFYRHWLKQSHNWSWYSKFYPSGAVPEDGRG